MITSTFFNRIVRESLSEVVALSRAKRTSGREKQMQCQGRGVRGMLENCCAGVFVRVLEIPLYKRSMTHGHGACCGTVFRSTWIWGCSPDTSAAGSDPALSSAMLV